MYALLEGVAEWCPTVQTYFIILCHDVISFSLAGSVDEGETKNGEVLY